MPTPNRGESQDDFVSRCMEYPDLQSKPEDQRAGECYGIYREHRHKAVKDAMEHLEAASQFDHGDMDEQTHKAMRAAHKHHAAMLKEYLRDTSGMMIHNPTA